MRASAIATRRARAVESFMNAREAIGDIEKNMSLFIITRGQWSMIDAILHVLDCVGPAKISVWTWVVAKYEIETLNRLRIDDRVLGGRLIIDHGARYKNMELIRDWKDFYGRDSVRYVKNHSKIARIDSLSGFRVLIRGSMNLNYNARFEQVDITEGGPDFDLVEEIESDLPILPDNCSGGDAFAASKLHRAFDCEQLKLFGGEFKTWKAN